MSDGAITLIAAECKDLCAGEPDLIERIRKAMGGVAESHWMFPGDYNEDLRFRGAICGVLLAEETTEEDREHILKSLDMLRALSAMLSGVPVNLDAMQEDGFEALPLSKLWDEAKGEVSE